MDESVINVPLTIFMVNFINTRLELDRKNREYNRTTIHVAKIPRGPSLIDPILSIIPQSNDPNHVMNVPLTLKQIYFINDRLCANRRKRERNLAIKNAKHPAVKPNGIKDPILEIKVQLGTDNTMVNIITLNNSG